MLTNSARDSTFIFRIMLPRCALTVISLIPSSLPTCLLGKPATTNAITSRSRGLRHEYRAFKARISVERSSNALLRTKAWRTAFSRISSLNGFVRNSYGSRLHRLHGYGNISVACDEDDRHLMPFHRNDVSADRDH